MRRFAIALLVACSACGDNQGSAAVDGGGPDGAVEPALVTVTSRAGIFAVRHALVVAHDPDGHVWGEGVTDADGNAEIAVPLGGMVTLARVADGSYTLETITSVDPGDHLLFGVQTLDEAPSRFATVTLPGPFPNSDQFLVDSGCGQAAADAADQPVEIGLRAGCDDASSLDLLGFAIGIGARAFSYALDAPLDPDVPVALPAWRTDWDHVSIHLQHLTPGLDAAWAWAAPLRGGRGFIGIGQDGATVDGAADLKVKLVRDFAYALEYGAEVYGEAGYAALRRSNQPVSSDATIEMAALLPIAQGVAAAADSAGGLSIDWTGVATDDYQFLIGWASWYSSSGTVTAGHTWLLAAPAGTSAPLRFPDLPDDLAAYRPAADLAAFGEVILDDPQLPGGYDDVKSLGIQAAHAYDDPASAVTARSSYAWSP